MVISKTLRHWFLIAAVALCLSVVGIPAAAQQQNQDEEVQMGQEVFNELKAKGEIIESSPLYDQLKPIADAITKAAQPRYNHPFRFYLVHEEQPNAFATPGGNVYVVDSLMYFVKNREQLAGTLCHEVSHTIHHDTVTLMEKQEKIEEREIAAAVLMGPTRAHVLTILLLGKLHSLGYSRDVEERADIAGSDICAQTGSNPSGWFGSSKIFRTPTPTNYRSSYPTTRMTRIGSMLLNNIFARTRRSSRSSIRIRSRLRRFPFQRTQPRCSCIERRMALRRSQKTGLRERITCNARKEKNNEQHF
jgi:predicted Zn-dependent protease